ncbi:chorismate-binding protein [Adhaeribacter rhizoryzae]|uniref:isochorismate synthase n=1 Tax=Adhaeribacter rhizoryzae TaxID=2607907 RepID=A0A5M6CZ41_9BACT|nr:chorismate-binding protein [Adhaeribacter rhizoryzae]KAA5540146.1 isochorismate synthase [Adhaeribacter rhizoryzae]
MTLEGDYKYTLEALFATAVRFNLPVAVWRLPDTAEIKLCVSLRGVQTLATVPQLEGGLSGFAFYPFQVTHTNPAAFINADITFSSLSSKLKFNFKLNENPEYVALVKRLQDYFLKIKNTRPATTWHVNRHALPAETNKTDFMAVVTKAIQAIEAGIFEKVVLSRAKAYPLETDFNVLQGFCQLQDKYKNAFVSLVSIPEVGTWMGASPEILVQINNKKVFKTVALAGTQPLPPETNPAKARWGQKEIEEQSMVERYILNCFKSIRLREYVEAGPRTVVAGNLMHLRTDFTVDMNQVPFPKLGSDMLMLLHPTSAVCGMPKEPATNFIYQHEGYDRSYYSGFLGPVQVDGESHIFVNLRCLQLFEDLALLYAGAGITAESEPEKEWQETKLKMETIRGIMVKKTK